MRDGDHDDVWCEVQQPVDLGARDPAVFGRELRRPLGDGVHGSDELVVRADCGRTLEPDQTATDYSDPQPGTAAHVYSLESAPTNSKSNTSSVAPAAAMAWRASAGLRAYTSKNPPPPAPTSFPPTTPLRRASVYRSSIRSVAIPGDRLRLFSQCSCISSAPPHASPRAF
jgi:hypothetical protein